VQRACRKFGVDIDLGGELSACRMRDQRLPGQQLPIGRLAGPLRSGQGDSLPIHLSVLEAQPKPPLMTKPKPLPVGWHADKPQRYCGGLSTQDI
jgi:hypothetical protein